jgi:hypothetical protein
MNSFASCRGKFDCFINSVIISSIVLDPSDRSATSAAELFISYSFCVNLLVI